MVGGGRGGEGKINSHTPDPKGSVDDGKRAREIEVLGGSPEGLPKG